MSTFAVINHLDEVLFKENLAAGIVSYSLEHAQHIFKKIIGHALETFPKDLKPYIGIKGHSAREITFSNGSSIRVDTTLRGGSYPLVLVSEFGKTCARNPQKAEEVITGTLQAVPKTGTIIIESTGEGADGYYAEMIMNAVRRGNDNLNDLEYKLFFYNWLQDVTYQLTDKVDYDVTLTDYFNKLEEDLNVKITQPQRNWYALQKQILGEKIFQEFPSTVAESFAASSDAYYFAKGVDKAYAENRCLYSPLYDGLLPVYVAMDIGVNDLTVMVFFQLAHGEIRVIDYYEDNNKGVDFYAKFLLQDKKYLYNTIFLPHDSVKRDPLDTANSYERDFRRLFNSTGTKFHVLKKMDKQLSISHAKVKLERCVFNVQKVKPFLDQVSKYRKRWHEATGRYVEEPYHNIHCFVGETLVLTDNGNKKISDIRTGDFVKTPNGYRKVLKVYKKKTQNLIKINVNGNETTCTPHHKIFTKKGLVTADCIQYNDQILTLFDEDIWSKIGYRGREKCLGFKDYFLSMNQKQLSDLMDINTKKTNLDTGDQEADRYIEKYGNITKVKSLKNMISTTLMEINQIIQSKTLRFSLIPSTCGCTCPPKKEKKYLVGPLEKQSKHQKIGTLLKKEKIGTVSMLKNVLRKDKNLPWFASIVKKSMNLFKNFLDIVGQIVLQPTEEIQEKTMNQEIAKYASNNLFAISTNKKRHVLLHVEECLGIEKEVYDLTIENDHCYFANNLLVSNSNYADAFQYMCQAVGHLEVVGGTAGALEKHKQAVESRYRRVV